MTTVKVSYGEDTRVMQVDTLREQDWFKHLVTSVKRVFNVSDQMALSIKYVDEENEDITVSSHAELQTALSLNEGDKKLRLFVNAAPLPQKADQVNGEPSLVSLSASFEMHDVSVDALLPHASAGANGDALRGPDEVNEEKLASEDADFVHVPDQVEESEDGGNSEPQPAEPQQQQSQPQQDSADGKPQTASENHEVSQDDGHAEAQISAQSHAADNQPSPKQAASSITVGRFVMHYPITPPTSTPTPRVHAQPSPAAPRVVRMPQRPSVAAAASAATAGPVIRAVHPGVQCSLCHVAPIRGIRYQCTVCAGINFCEECEAALAPSTHPLHHHLIKMRVATHTIPPRSVGVHIPHQESSSTATHSDLVSTDDDDDDKDEEEQDQAPEVESSSGNESVDGVVEDDFSDDGSGEEISTPPVHSPAATVTTSSTAAATTSSTAAATTSFHCQVLQQGSRVQGNTLTYSWTLTKTSPEAPWPADLELIFETGNMVPVNGRGMTVSVPSESSGQSAELSVEMRVPPVSGTLQSTFQLRSAGCVVGEPLVVRHTNMPPKREVPVRRPNTPIAPRAASTAHFVRPATAAQLPPSMFRGLRNA